MRPVELAPAGVAAYAAPVLEEVPGLSQEDVPARRAARADIRAAFRAGRVAERLVSNPYPERSAEREAFESGRTLERLLNASGNAGPSGVAPMTRGPTAG